jgi:hypothetical protein
MYPWRLIAMLEKADPSFQDLFYPQRLRCRLDKRIVRAIEENWPAYFPSHKKCRGSSWSLTIPENKPLYKPHPKSKEKVEQWKIDITGSVAEMRAYRADISWRRFALICRNIPRLRPLLKDFKPLADFLISEESMWSDYGGVAVGQEDFFQRQIKAMLGPGSPYHHSDTRRLRFLYSSKPTIEKIRAIGLMQQLFDRPLMILAVLQTCASKSECSQFWLPIQNHIAEIIKTPSPLTFRKTWLEHAMQVSGAIKRTGKSNPRKWATMLVAKNDPALNVINAKAVEVNGWLKGKKQPSMESVRRSAQVIFKSNKLNPRQTRTEAGKDLWLFSWMITLWLEKHFAEIAAEFKGDNRKIKTYYRRFFHCLKLAQSKEAGGLFARQP